MRKLCKYRHKNEVGTKINPRIGPFYYYSDMIIVDEDFQKQVNPVTMTRELLPVDGGAGEHRDMWDKFMVVKYPEIKLMSKDNHKAIPRGRVDCKIKNGQLVFWVTLDKCIVEKEPEIIRQFNLDNYETEFHYGTMNYVCDMEYEIMNRKNARYASGETRASSTAIISITDVGDELNEFYPTNWIHAVLHIQFDDVIERGYNCITKTNAQEIAEFALENYDKVERLIIHCEYGQSRSAGVAAALSQHFEGHDNGISTDPRYFPNWTCYKYVLRALEEISSKEKR